MFSFPFLDEIMNKLYCLLQGYYNTNIESPNFLAQFMQMHGS